MRLHASNLRLALELLQRRRSEMAPPLEQHRVADELKPRCELQAGLFEHLLELVGRDILGVADFVGVDIEIDVRLDEKNVVDCVKSQCCC